MSTLTKIWNFLQGKKIYLLAVAVIGYGFYMKFFAQPSISWDEFITMMFDGTLLIGARSTLAKIGIKV